MMIGSTGAGAAEAEAGAAAAADAAEEEKGQTACILLDDGFFFRTYHKECVGLSRSPGGYFSCPQHKCAKCERNSQEAGGMLFRW